ncbi:MAG: hypothetical protein IKK13_06390, partial [Clostridia bacterium]|nr:hypothetical protein [Clostridia bacterium]
TAVQRAGLQGEHNATKLIFYISQELAEALGAHGEKVVYRFEAYTGTGEKNSTVPEEIEISDGTLKEFTLNYGLENWLTRGGGNISVYLIFSILSEDETLIDLYTYPARLKLESVPEGKYTDGKNYESVAKLSVAAEDAAKRAEDASDKAKAAETNTKAAEKVLTEGTFIFLGGDAKGKGEVKLVIDNELNKNSNNPISNAAVAAEFGKYTDSLTLEKMLDNAVASALKTAKLDAHPVGSYYWSESSTEPSALFGGTWERITDTFVLAAGDKHKVGDVGGFETVVLTETQLPKHKHNVGFKDNDSEFRGLSFGYGEDQSTHSAIVQGNATIEWKTLEISDTGSGEAHENMPPYVTAYCWKRIA